MTDVRWAAVDDFVGAKLSLSDPVLEAALAANVEAALPSIDVSPAQGKFLHLLTRMVRAERILEIGTLGGYSTIWLGRALSRSGRLVTLEAEPRHADVARRNIAAAGLGPQVELRVGMAKDLLADLVAEGGAPFDVVFIDADKPGIPDYFTSSLELTRPGSVIVVDNVIRGGAVIEADSQDPRVHGVRRFFDLVAAEPRVSATTLQTVGAKGYDGFTLLVVT